MLELSGKSLFLLTSKNTIFYLKHTEIPTPIDSIRPISDLLKFHDRDFFSPLECSDNWSSL